jgi:Protein of unknown function (DUF3073)
MGRGRAKAKQTRVARDLKYRDVGTDLTQLANELRKTGNGPVVNNHVVEQVSKDAEPDDDEYAAYAGYGDEDGDDEYESGKADDGGSHRSHHREG